MELMRDSLDHCVKCTICETFCPVSKATPLFPGPKYVGPQAERFRVHDISPDVYRSIEVRSEPHRPPERHAPAVRTQSR